MEEPIQHDAETARTLLIALQQIYDDRQEIHNGLQFERSLLVEELEATQLEISARITKLDQQIIHAAGKLNAAKSALLDFKRIHPEP